MNDVLAVVLVTIVLSVYSLAPKPNWLNRLNWLLVPVFTALFVYATSFFEPKVANGVMWAFFFSVYAFLIPFLLYFGIVIANLVFCISTYGDIQNNES